MITTTARGSTSTRRLRPLPTTHGVRGRLRESMAIGISTEADEGVGELRRGPRHIFRELPPDREERWAGWSSSTFSVSLPLAGVEKIPRDTYNILRHGVGEEEECGGVLFRAGFHRKLESSFSALLVE